MHILDELRHPTAVLTGATALSLWGVGDLVASTIDFFITRRVRIGDPNVKLSRRTHLAGDTWTVVNALPVARPHYAATYALKHGQGDLEQVARALQEAVDEGTVTPEETHRALGPLLTRQGLDAAVRARVLPRS